MERFGDGRDWFFERRYGMFVHWGLYALEGWHEQHQLRQRLSRAEYEQWAVRWNPGKFNPEAWLDLAEEAGMEYLCFTTKHHDGFCMWDTKLTDFNTMNTPYGRDILGMLAEACHKRQFPLCLYYSCADWHHPHYPNEGRHHELPPQPGDEPNLERYLDFVRGQVRELCTQYGQIHGFWWDMNVPQHYDPSLNQMIRELQPGIIINNRGYDEGDFGTPERDYDPEGEKLLAFEKPTEACQSVGVESWGWREEEDYYSDRYLMSSIDRYLARGANYLLNVGPTAEGEIAPVQQEILRRLGRWIRRVREALWEVEPCSHWTENRSVLLTRRGKTLYVHLYQPPVCDAVKLKPINALPQKAILLNDGRSVEFSVDVLPSEHATQQTCLRLKRLPVNEMANEVLIVKLEY